jgi:hypothetical protein
VGAMNFNHFPFEEFEEPISDLEDVIELEIAIFGPFPETLSEREDFFEHYILGDDYLQKEIERQEQERVDGLLRPKIP